MSRNSTAKKQRHIELKEIIQNDPFITDEELAEKLDISVPTIRLDRLELGIPELRQRIKDVASKKHSEVKSLKADEIIGELVDLELGVRGISILETDKTMVFEQTKIVRGHYIYSFAESLAISVIDSNAALVGIANVKYKIPVYSGKRLVAKAEVKKKRDKNYIVWVFIYEKENEVFRGKFILVAIDG